MFRLTLFFVALSCFQGSRHSGLKIDKKVKVDEYEAMNYEAIAKIHTHLDDDQDGEVDFKESDGFIRDELKVTDKNRHNLFHGNDSQISVNDLWKSWVLSEVHNWTNAQVVTWLVEHVHLPQYTEHFTAAHINGSVLPRLAAQQFNGVFLGIKDPKHRKKISLRAMDVILFGSPASGHNFIKDIVVAFSVLVATVGCWLALHQKRRAQKQMDQMMKDLSILQIAEQDFGELQERLIKAEEEHELANEQRANLEMRLQEEMKSSKTKAVKLQDAKDGSKEHLQRLEDAENELKKIRKALYQAEKDLEFQSWRAPLALKEWLQMTYFKETKQFILKRTQALKEMADAKEGCDRIRKKRNSLIGSFRMAHDLTIDEVDQCILKAKLSLAEVTHELQERQHRWSRIESLCGLHIVSSTDQGKADTSQQTGSPVFQALANCANIGSVGSGRKLSGNTPPKEHHGKSDDLPPAYASVASPKMTGKHASGSSTVLSQPDVNNYRQPVIINGHDNANASPNHTNGSAKTDESIQLALTDINPSIINGHVGSFSGSRHSPPANKPKKKIPWFTKRQSTSDVEIAGESEEDRRRKKIKWRWRSAALKSTARRMEQNGKHDGKRDSGS